MTPNKLLVTALALLLLTGPTAFGSNNAAQAAKPEYSHSCADAPAIPAVGVSTAGVYLSRKYRKPAWNYPVYANALKDLGAEFIDEHYYRISTGRSSEENRKNSIANLKKYLKFLKENNLSFMLSSEVANFRQRLEYKPGKNFLEPEPGLHYFKLPEELLRICSQSENFIGINYDELEHMQLSNNQFTTRSQTGDVPALVATTQMSLPQAYQALVEKASELKKYHAPYGALCSVEMVWPVMHHIFARAGWTLCPKLLKESWNPVVISMGLGAAIEYSHNGADLWFTPDLWFWGSYPGHSIEELRSALLTAHWLGTGRIYVENLDHVDTRKKRPPHPDARFGSLVGFSDEKTYEVTPYGRLFQWYAKQYRPKHPRPFSWKQARCRIAIVRFPDSCWGAAGGDYRDRLLGAKDQHSTPVTEAWFKIWHILTRSTIPPNGLSFNSHHIKHWKPRFFCPAPPVLVFDHRIGDEHPNFDFCGAEVIFLTGITVTKPTQQLIEKKVSEGLKCISLPHLVPEDILKAYTDSQQDTSVIPHSRGEWIVTDDFLDTKVLDAVETCLPPEDQMQYIFGRHNLVLKRIDGDNNRIKVLLDGKEVGP